MNKKQPIWRNRELVGGYLCSQYSPSSISLDWVDNTDTTNYKIPGIVAVFPEVPTNSKTWCSPYVYLSMKKLLQSGSAKQGPSE